MVYQSFPEFQAGAIPEGIIYDPSYTGLTLLDYSQIVDVYNPRSTNRQRSKDHLAELKSLEHHFDQIIPVETTPDKYETALIIEEAMGDIATKTVVLARTGDGGNGGIARAVIGRGAALWQANAGFANNLSRSLYPMRHRSDPEMVMLRGNIYRTKAIDFEITGPDGQELFSDLAIDEVGFGNMANAQLARERPEHRDILAEAWDSQGIKKPFNVVQALLRTAKIGAEAIDAAPAFEVKFGKADPNASEDHRASVSFNELTFSNIGHIAWIGRIRDSHLADQKLAMITDGYRTRLGPRLFYAMLYTFGVKSEDIPDGHVVEFDLVTDANAQSSGDPFTVPEGSHVKISRTEKDLLVVSTRKRP